MESVILATDPSEPHQSPASAEVEALIEERPSPGLIVVAPPMRILHMSQRAWELLRDLSETEHCSGKARVKLARGLLPPAIGHICRQIFKHLHERPVAKDWERFESKLLIGTPHLPLLVRGFGVPDQGGREQSRVVVLLEELAQPKEQFSKEMIQHFGFTDREQEVVQCLGKGWTNKEIASDLGMALPTVKEHIRHIMDKTKANTRTGVLVQVFRR